MAMTTGAVAGASVGSASRKKYNNSEYDDYNQDDATQYDNPYGNNNSRNNDKWGEKEEYDIKTNNSDPYGQYPDEYDQYGYEYPASNEPRWKVFMEKYLCRCCPKSKKHRIICGVVVGIVLLAIIIPLAIFFPQMPDIRVVSISLTNVDKGAYTFTTPDNNGNLNQMTLGFSLEMQLATYNPNMYGLNVDSINVYAQMMVNTSYVLNANKVSPLTSFASLAQIVNEKGPIPLATKKPADYKASLTPQIGTANTTGIFFPSKQWVNYTMTFYLSYTPDPYVGLLNDPAIMEVADSCGITSRYTPRGRPMRIHYEGKSVIAALKPLGYAPGISNDVMISCPIKQCQIDQVIDAVKNGGDAMDSLKSVLSAPQNC
ncbi:hypothetical protein BCR33DRAFT_457610 [Rhizoclosmatium globosum]|uniref:Uncharacterized protein n=1 Tax=Rhizoclosmatium globosum TaxID=329046 RepID=A0A1Y2CYU8_9FUNG|nr:hypothetical protein BCR33DRAFT_457610 [Rhizoclosmatium globosum]|eukprot:ORY51515.1 hypothetical protein BCR33DRAFT_457610 [Rhizoclosmatium globosum]